MDFSNYLANKLIDATVRNEPYETPVDVFLCLYTLNPTKEDTGTEVREASYNRQDLKMSEPVDGVCENQSQVDFATATSNWGLITHVGIRDQAYDGNLLYFTALDNPKEVLTGDQFKIDADKLQITLT